VSLFRSAGSRLRGYTQLLTIISHPLTRVVLFAVCSLSLFHWAHRFRYTLYDGLQIKHLNELINTTLWRSSRKHAPGRLSAGETALGNAES